MATNKPISQASIDELAAAIAQAINKSGGSGGRSYNPISNQTVKHADPAQRAAEIRNYKTAQNANQIMRELVEVQKKSIKSTHDLEQMLEYNRKTLSQALNKYDDYNDVQEALVKELRAQLNNPAVSKGVKELAGSIEKLEDVLAFNDAARAATELSKALKEGISTGKNVEHVKQSIEGLKKALPAGKTLSDVDQSLEALDQRLEMFLKTFNAKLNENGKYVFHDKAGNERSDRDQKKINKAMQALMQKNPMAKKAGTAADNISTQGHEAGIKSNINSMKKLDTVFSEGSRRIGAWGVKVSSAAYALDKLGEAAAHLYATFKEAAATGTQRSAGDVFAREARSMINGVSVESVQKAQVDGAHNRSAAGRGKYDDALYAGSSEYFKLTGDKDKALEQYGATLKALMGAGVGFETAKKSATGLTKTFGELQYLTGMTVEQINALNGELMSGNEYRQSLNGLDEKGRAAAVQNLDLMLKENVLRGISIQQSKDMIKAQRDIANPFSPKARMKNAVMLRQLGAAQGVNVDKAAELVQAGGRDKYINNLQKQGMSAEAAKQQADTAQKQFEDVGTKNSKQLGENSAGGFMTEAIGEKMPGLKSLFDGTFDQSGNQANKVIGKAAEDFQQGSKDFLAGVAMMTGGWVANFAKSAGGALAIAFGAYMLKGPILNKLAGTSLGSVAGSAAGGIGNAIKSGFGSLKNTFSGGMMTGLKNIGTAGFSAMKNVVSNGLLDSMKKMGAAGAGSIKSMFSGGAIGSGVGGALNGLKNMGKAGMGAINNAWSYTKSVGGIMNTIKSVVPKMAGAAVTKGAGILSAGKSLLKGGLGTAVVAIGADYAGDKLKESGHQKTGAAAKVLGSTAGYAGTGALLGSFIPVIGNAVGAAIGGVIGAGVGLYENWGDLTSSDPASPTSDEPKKDSTTPTPINNDVRNQTGSIASPSLNGFGSYNNPQVSDPLAAAFGIKNPIQPSVSAPLVNTETTQNKSNGFVADTLNASGLLPSKEQEGKKDDPMLALGSGISLMTQTLSSILTLLQTSTEDLATSNEVGVEMQRRLHRALKSGGIAGDSAPASTAYNT